MAANEIITIRIKSITELLFSEGAAFTGNKKIRPEAEEYILDEAGKIKLSMNLALIIHVREPFSSTDNATAAIRDHFKHKKDKSERSFKRVLQTGWKSLFIAITFLAFVVTITLGMSNFFKDSGFMITLREVLVIIGWVALWRPADILLYEWRPFKKESKLFHRLANCDIRILTIAS